MLRFSEGCQPGNLFVQTGCNLIISTKPFDQDNSNFYGKFFINLSTTFMLYDFSFEQLKSVENSFCADCSKLTDLQKVDINSKPLW